MTAAPARLRLLLIARAFAVAAAPASERPPARPARATPATYADAVRRFAPPDLAPEPWRTAVAAALTDLVREGLLGEDLRLADRPAAAPLLGSAFGAGFVAAPRWSRLANHLVPCRGLGAPLDDRQLERLSDRDALAAAVVGRVYGLWSRGAPPTPAALCDQLAWLRLGLPGKAKRLPEELRALILQRELATAAAAPAARLLRLLAARELGVVRTELRSWRDALGRRWLAGAELTATTTRASDVAAPAPHAPRPPAPADAPAPAPPPDFVADLRAALPRVAADGKFGNRKVFIAAAWRALREQPAWADLRLEDFQARLLAAHRASALELTRADLITSMPAALVAESALHADGATFHFVVWEGS